MVEVSRRFDGVDDVVVWSIGSCSLTGAWTLAAVLKLDTGVGWQSFLSNDITATGSDVAFGRSGTSGQLAAFRGGGAGGISDAISISSADGWCLYVVTKASGNPVAVTCHKYPIGGSPTHTAAETMHNSAAQDSVRFGSIDGSDFFDGWLAVAAEWNSVLSDANIESLVTTFTRANWLSLSPVGLWDEYDVFATDRTGNGADRTSITGTADDADDPTGWESWAGAAPAVIPSLVTARTRA